MATIRHKPETYAITILTHQRQRLFQRFANAELMVETLFRYRDQGRFAFHGFVVMPDHVHVLITPAIDQSTSRCVQLIKGGYSFAVRNQFSGEVWHSGYHEHRIRDIEDFAAQKLYIANNPVRKDHVEYAFVHGNYAERIDAIPSHLMRATTHTPGAEAHLSKS
jgi:putative transposase